MNREETRQKIQEIVDKIVREFEPEKVILFGSWAWGNPTPDSDVDLLIVKETKTSTRDLAREIDGSLWGRTLPLDIIVFTPQGVRNGDFFMREITTKGILLYERK